MRTSDHCVIPTGAQATRRLIKDLFWMDEWILKHTFLIPLLPEILTTILLDPSDYLKTVIRSAE